MLQAWNEDDLFYVMSLVHGIGWLYYYSDMNQLLLCTGFKTSMHLF